MLTQLGITWSFIASFDYPHFYVQLLVEARMRETQENMNYKCFGDKLSKCSIEPRLELYHGLSIQV